VVNRAATPPHSGGLVDLVCLGVVTVWGVNFVIMKRALERFEIPVFNIVRFAVMLIIGWVLVARLHRRGSSPLLPARAHRHRIIASGLVGFFGYLYGFSIAIHHTSAFSAGILTAMSSLFTAVLLAATGSEQLTRAHLIALGTAVLGAVVFVIGRGDGRVEFQLGDVFALLAAFLYASYLVINRPLLGSYPPLALTTWSMTVGFVAVLAVALPFVGRQDWSRVDATAWIAMAWCATLPVFVAWTVWAWANARAGVARPSLFMVLTPVVSGITAWWVLDERVRPLQIIGVLLVVSALALGTTAARRRAAEAASAPVLRGDAISPRAQ
jgi:O-acetylserine/cysteine efflux transporter